MKNIEESSLTGEMRIKKYKFLDTWIFYS